MKKLLIVNNIPPESPQVLNALGYFQNGNFELEIINTYEKNYSHCVGCNVCWLVTPGVCSIKDGYDELIKAYLRNDAVVFVCNTTLNFVDFRMKNIIDCMLPLLTMGIKIKDNQCRHIPRYDKLFMNFLSKNLGNTKSLDDKPYQKCLLQKISSPFTIYE